MSTDSANRLMSDSALATTRASLSLVPNATVEQLLDHIDALTLIVNRRAYLLDLCLEQIQKRKAKT